MLSVNIVTRVLQIKYNNSLASSFTVELDGKQYLVTARHIFPQAVNNDNVLIQVHQDGAWKNLDCNILLYSDSNVDIAVLELNKNSRITYDLPINISSNGVGLSQDAYILGFPFGLRNEILEGNNSYHTPFIKKGCISAIVNENGNTIIYADTVNNIGFSGGPIVVKDIKDNKTISIIGVVSGYRIHKSHVFDSTNNQTNNYVKENSGLTKGYSIEFVQKIINENKVT